MAIFDQLPACRRRIWRKTLKASLIGRNFRKCGRPESFSGSREWFGGREISLSGRWKSDGGNGAAGSGRVFSRGGSPAALGGSGTGFGGRTVWVRGRQTATMSLGVELLMLVKRKRQICRADGAFAFAPAKNFAGKNHPGRGTSRRTRHAFVPKARPEISQTRSAWYRGKTKPVLKGRWNRDGVRPANLFHRAFRTSVFVRC